MGSHPLASGGGLTGALPLAVDHRADGSEGPVKNQQSVGACTAFSLSTAMDHAVRKMGRQEVVSPLHVWSKYGRPYMGEAGDSTVGESISVESVWPYDPVKACKLTRDSTDHCGKAYNVTPGSASTDPEIRFDQTRADASGRYKLEAYEKLSVPTNTDEIAAVLAGGDDIWLAFYVNSDAWSYKSVVNGVIPDYSAVGSSGHAVVLCGYRTVNGKRQFLIHNSWGETWGDRGYAWISEKMVQQQMRYGYKIRVTDGSGTSPPGPSQTSGCPNNQVKDSVFGTCSARCASGSAPAAGVCLPVVPGINPPPNPQQNKCPAGQAPDAMIGVCMPLCPGGSATIGGMCLPMLQQR